MKKNHYYFNVGLGFWLLALLAWVRYSARVALLLSFLAVCTFLVHCLQHQVLCMFKKIFSPKKPISESVATVAYPSQSGVKKNSNTIISEDTSLEGNLTVNGLITVHGEIHGNIDAKEGCINVTQTGRVYGNIFSHELIINGNVQGECTSDIINIDKEGCIHGTLVYNTLNISTGGIFLGQAILMAKNDSESLATLVEENSILPNAHSHKKRSAKCNK